MRTFKLLIIAFFMTIVAPINYAQQIATVKVAPKIMKELSSWDNRIVFITSSTNPIVDLKDITNPGKEVGIWGAELFDKVEILLNFIGLQQTEMGLIGNAYHDSLFYNYSKLRIFITWESFAKKIIATGGGIKVRFEVSPEEEKNYFYVRFQKVTLNPTTESESSDDFPTLIFGDILESIEMKEDKIKVRHIYSQKEGWLSRYLLTQNKKEINYLCEENIFPKYLLASEKGKETLLGLTDLKAKRGTEGEFELDWEIKGFSFIIHEDIIENFSKNEMSKRCKTQLKSNTLYVYDGENFIDINNETMQSPSTIKQIVSQTQVEHMKWFMRFKEKSFYPSPKSSRQENEEPIGDIFFGNEVELLDWDSDSYEIKVRSVDSGQEGWISRYYLSPNKWEIDFLNQKQLIPDGGLIFDPKGEISLLAGTPIKMTNDGFAVDQEIRGVVSIFDGNQKKQKEFCQTRNIPYHHSTFAFYINDGQNIIEVLPQALTFFRQ